MKEKLLKHIYRSLNIPEFVSAVFILLMLTVQLFIFGPKGYRNITIIKYVSFLSLCAAYILTMLILKATNRLKAQMHISTSEILVFAFMIFSIVSAICSEFFPDTIIGANRREGALTLSIYCLIFLMLRRYSWSGKWIVYSLGTAIFIYSLICVLQLFEINIFGLFPDGFSYYDAGVKYSGEFIGTLGNAGLSAALLCLALPILLIYIVRSADKARFVLIIPFILAAAVLHISRIAASLLGFYAGIFFSLPFIFSRDKKQCVLWITVELLLLAGGLAAVYSINFDSGILYELNSILHGNFKDSFGSSRIFIWRNTLPLIMEKPLLGGGADTLAQRIGVIFETVKDDGTVKRAVIDAAHNEYLNIAVCQGIPAMIIYLFAIISTFVKLLRRGRKDPVSIAIGTGLLAYLIQAFFGISMFIAAPYFWIFWAMLERRLDIIKKNLV